ncbi:phospholipase A and acyltransferase 2-like [Acipenser ruthenus]|uniref:phospholipase A and acyltransferase 2-like n=1 Tax=Acipenser ruthenus TaxID=7906 RepID=UPI0027427EB8|nr:phospholipase A and acyltransferase 2-like [Acipenser ruthenus]
MEQPKLGDLIEISHKDFQHWAVYVGNGKVVHLTTSDGICNSPGTRRGEVKKESLTEVVGDCQFKVCNLQDAWATPYQPEQIAKRAWACVGKTMTYSCDKYTCEHFAIQMRYGKMLLRDCRLI